MSFTQYDEIAEAYDEIIEDHPVRQVIEHTFWRLLGDLNGQSVLDLACGSGIYTEIFKRRRASRVVGVDVSSELIALAREREARSKVGIEYLVGDGRTLGKIGDFDLVTSAFMLSFAPTKEDLLRMCRTVTENLHGERFVAITLNVRAGARLYGNEEYKNMAYITK